MIYDQEIFDLQERHNRLSELIEEKRDHSLSSVLVSYYKKDLEKIRLKMDELDPDRKIRDLHKKLEDFDY